jgi:glycosyltransferase involved in cell wall biosynthesis
VLLGSGPEKEKLMLLKQTQKLDQVYFLNAVSKQEMPSILKAVNASVIPLRKLDLFLGAIPSKIFESLSMELPVLLGVDGEARSIFIDQGHCGIYFEPENINDLVTAIKKLVTDPQAAQQLGKNGRAFVNTSFNRENIARDFYQRLKQV